MEDANHNDLSCPDTGGSPPISPCYYIQGLSSTFRTLLEYELDKYSSTSPSSSFSSASSSLSSTDEDESDGERLRKAPARHQRIKKQLRARDRDNEIDFLLKRKSLQLSRQSSLNASEPYKSHSAMSRVTNLMESSTTSSLSSTKAMQSVLQLAKYLRSHCDRILDRALPFAIDSTLLWLTSEAIGEVIASTPCSDDEDGSCTDYEAQVLFLSDFFEQSPSLSISLSESQGSSSIPGHMDLTLFRSLRVLELWKIPPHMVSGLNTVRVNLRKLKVSRCLDSLDEIFTSPLCSELLSSNVNTGPQPLSSVSLTSVWRELRELDVSFNRIQSLDSRALELTPAVEILNLSRNRISSIDCTFSRILSNLTVLNLNYNQLTALPPLPPNLKILLLSNNCLSSISAPSFPNLEMLDLSENMVSDEKALEPLRQLSSLKSLAFIGNPITYSENYRNTLCANLSRLVVTNKAFLLDKKRLSSSEVRLALEQIKRHRPALILSPINNPIFVPKAGNAGGARLTDLKSLTQSYDSSSSSSVRSACRKKPKIREVVILDSDEVEGPGSSTSEDSEVGLPVPEKQDKSMGIKSAVMSLIERHGQENWLLRQSGKELSKLCNIRDRAYIQGEDTVSRSLPSSRGDNTSFYSAVSEWEDSSMKTAAGGDSSTSTLAVQGDSLELENSDDSIRRVTDSSNNSSDGLLFYSCVKEDTDNAFGTEPDFSPLLFRDESGTAVRFRTFQNGRTYKLVILDHFLYETDPEKSDEILCKWDLKSLKAITEGRANAETETVEFHLSFDTLRKHWRERSFIMGSKDYRAFEEQAGRFLQLRTLQEFDGFQCVKCNSQFSKGMAKTSVVGEIPKEVPICPHCDSQYLIPLESIPLPNNESLLIETSASTAWGPLRTSTPVSGLLGTSLPITSSFFRPNASKPPSSIGSAQSSPTNPLIIPNALECDNNNKGTSSDGTSKHTKSDSDIETLSCDSSSIEVLGKGTDSASDDVQVEEGVEIEILGSDFGIQFGKNTSSSTALPMMTESNSSGSYAGSICTQYEKTINANLTPISQQFSSRPPIPFPRPTSSTTLVPAALGSSPARSSSFLAPGAVPIKYDYENFAKVDHRLQLFCELSVFKHAEEKLLALTKVVVITSNGAFLCIVIFSNKKLYIYKIIGVENDKPEGWLQKFSSFPLTKLGKLDVLIGRHGVGLDLSAAGKYFALVFRDSKRTSSFIEFFLSDICMEMELLCLVQDFSQTQKVLMSPNNPIGYFGILRYALCEVADKAYPVPAIVLTDEGLILVADLSWLVNRGSETVSVKHERSLGTLRQVECLEIDPTFVKLVFELDTHVFWDICFETEEEKEIFVRCLRNHTKDVPFISLSQPLEP